MSRFSKLKSSSNQFNRHYGRRLHLESLERRQLLAELAQVSFEVTNLVGDVVSTLVTGDEYYLKAYVQDVRSAGAQGVTAAFFDVAVSDNDLITIENQAGATSGILFSTEYPNGHTGANLIETSSQEFDEVGAATLSNYGSAKTPFFQVKFSADTAGSLSFSANPADLLGNVFTLGGLGDITASEVTYGSVTVDIEAPTLLTNDTLTINEDASTSTIAVLSNDTGGSALWTIQSVSQISSGGNVQISGDGKSVLYTPAANFSGTETFKYTTTDGGGVFGQATVTVTVNAQNDAPVNSVPSAQVFDAVTGTVVFDSSNRITVDDVDVLNGNVRVTLFAGGGSINLASTAGLTFLNGSVNNSGYLLFDGTLDDVNAALLDLTYTANANVTADVLTIDTHDLGNAGAGGAKVDRDTIALSLQGSTGVNQAPVNTVPGAQVFTNINRTITFNAGSQVSINDPDAGNALMRVTLFVNGGSTINLASTAGLTFLNGSVNNSSYLLFDGTQANINAALQTMTYTAGANVSADILTIDTHDLGHSGTGGAKVDRDTIALSLQGSTGVNQTPVNTVPGAQVFTNANRTVTFSAASQISVSDPDVGNGQLRVTLFVQNGTINLQSTAGLTFLNNSVNNSSYLLFDGTQADINAALQTVTYTANSNISVDLLTIDTHDLGNSGSGGAKVDRDTIAIALVSTGGRSGGPGSGEANSRSGAATPTSPAANADALFSEPATLQPVAASDRSSVQLVDLLASANAGRAKSSHAADNIFSAEEN